MDNDVKNRFIRAVKNHRMTIEQDDGVFRCVHFGKPSSGAYSFRLVTWPGHLSISGDLDDFTFRRLHDMFDFFRFAGPEYDRSDGPNYGYWAEKTQSVSRHGGLSVFDEELYTAAIRHDFAQHISGMKLSEARLARQDAEFYDLFFCSDDKREAIEKAMTWRCPVTNEHPFQDFYEHRLDDWSFGFRFACHAIQWGIKQYDLHKQGRTQADHDRRALIGEVG